MTSTQTALGRENRELRRANEILQKASAYFAQAELVVADPDDGSLHRRPPRGIRSPGSICAVLPIAPSGPTTPQSTRSRPGAAACPSAARRKAAQGDLACMGGQLPRLRHAQGVATAPTRGIRRCTMHRVARLMSGMGLRGAIRGRRFKTTVPANVADCPLDLVKRDFAAERPTQLWVSDLTHVATWRGFVYVAFVIDAFSRRIVGWRVSNSLKSDLALDALEQAICEREEAQRDRLVHHSDRGVQYLSGSATPSGSPRQALSRQSAARAIRTITRWRSR